MCDSSQSLPFAIAERTPDEHQDLPPCQQQLSYPTQEVGLDTHQSQDRQELPYPTEETGPSAERTPDEHEDLPPCQQQLSGADINEVRSTGEWEHALEHTCSPQELQLWRQVSDR